MSRWEFMRQLEELLSDISPGEREEALKYYNDYINDGGKENEANVLKSLGTPEQVAAIIKEGLLGSSGEFTEAGFQNKAEHSTNQVTNYQSREDQANNKSRKNGMSGGMIALIIILCIFASPFIISIGAGIFGAFIGILAALFGILLAFSIVAIVCTAVGFSLVFIGIFRIFFGPLTGLALIAAGLIVGGIGLLFLLISVLLFGKAIPAVFKGIIYLCGRIFGGKRGVKNA